jgi:sodium-dependent phosphate transporter
MPEAHQFDYLLALGFIFAFADGYGIGANDVANSFATSVSSRSLTMPQAICLAAMAEFLGALLLGSRVTSTVKNNIVSPTSFSKDPYVIMLLMVCALIASSTWLNIATVIGLPVSTTHCIIGAITGGGVAALGIHGPRWGWSGAQGVSAIIASWFIAPFIAGGFAVIIYLATKFGVLKTKNPLRNGMIAIPIYFGLTFGILTMLIVWKGAPALHLDNLSKGAVIGSILGVAGVVVLICIFWLIPYFHRRLVQEDWTLRWYHVFIGPMLPFRGPVPPLPEGHSGEVVQNFARGFVTKNDVQAELAAHAGDTPIGEVEKGQVTDSHASGSSNESPHTPELDDGTRLEEEVKLPWYNPKRIFSLTKRALLHGVIVDVVDKQGKVRQKSKIDKYLGKNVVEMHTHAYRYDNKTEYLYSMLQVFTATTASFAHGSNDVANAMGPLTAIYQVWNTGTTASKLDVPVWVLAYGGAAIVIGLATYGYNIMRNLGNRITLHSPSRGFSMELGAALTVVFASRLGLPISTTQCIVGATAAVGLCNGNFKSINWRMVGWCYFGWIMTLPITAVVSGLLLAMVLNAPHFAMFN